MLNRILIDETNQDFAKVVQVVKENGPVIIIINDEQYVVQKYNDEEINKKDFVDSALFREIAEKVVERNIKAFKELAK